MQTVFKYPGSKWKIADKLIRLIPEHHTYVEPFFGSGAVFFRKTPSNIETINDLDSDVVNLFRCIREDSERLARMIMTYPYSRQEYDNQFSDTMEKEEDTYKQAVHFLIKCWQGHGFRTNGYVGWKNDVQGREKMYTLWDWYRLPLWVIEIAERLRCVQIECRPALEVIERFDCENVFQYWDPPYLFDVRRGKMYRHEMTDGDHEELLKKALKSKAKLMISGYESKMYNDYLRGWNKVYLKSCAVYNGNRREVVWMNYSRKRTVQMTFEDFL